MEEPKKYLIKFYDMDMKKPAIDENGEVTQLQIVYDTFKAQALIPEPRYGEDRKEIIQSNKGISSKRWNDNSQQLYALKNGAMDNAFIRLVNDEQEELFIKISNVISIMEQK